MISQGECVQNETGDGGSEDHWVTNDKSLTPDNQEAPAMFFDFVIVSLSFIRKHYRISFTSMIQIYPCRYNE